MDRRERIDDPEEATRVAQDGHQAQIWTSIPGVIQSFDPGEQTAVVQPVIQGIIQAKDGSFSNANMPLLLDVPVEFPSGGGYTMTFPIAPGDECMVEFSSRCIDAWWQNGGTANVQMDQRMHDLSDAVCRVGVRSQARKLANISTTTAQFRSDDKTVYVELDQAGGIVTIKAPTKIILDSPEVHTTGKITAVDDVTAGTISLQNHVHSGVAVGAADSGPPVP